MAAWEVGGEAAQRYSCIQKAKTLKEIRITEKKKKKQGNNFLKQNLYNLPF